MELTPSAVKLAKDMIPGGKAEGKTDKDFPRDQMAMGQKIEMEHVRPGEQAKAREIARDHLTEFPDYYSRLKKMESEAKEKKAGADDTYYCPTCGWRGKGSSLVNGKCPKCGKSVQLVKKASAGDEGGRAPTAQDKAKIQEWMRTHDNPKDEDFHAFAEGLGLNVHLAEGVAYDMAHELSKKAMIPLPDLSAEELGELKAAAETVGQTLAKTAAVDPFTAIIGETPVSVSPAGRIETWLFRRKMDRMAQARQAAEAALKSSVAPETV